MTGRFPVLLHSALYSALRRLPADRRIRFRRLAERLSAGRWGGGTRVKKLRGVSKPVFEARQDDGDRVLFTLARSAAPDGDTRATFLQVWDVVAHDDVSAAAARVNRAAEAEFLDYAVLESEVTDEPPPHPAASFDEVPPAAPGAPAGVLELMLPPEDFRPADREEIEGGVRWYLLPERLLVDDAGWQGLVDDDSDELELKLTAEQYAVVRAPGPLLLSGSAGSGKTTIAVHRLAAAADTGAARLLYLTYSGWLRDHAQRLYRALRACRGGEAGAAPDFLTMEELYRSLLGAAGASVPRLADYPEFARWYAAGFRRRDAALAWEEIRSIVKGACVDGDRELLRRDEYEALGRKRAPLFVGERPRLYEVARRWQEHLRAAGRADEIDLCRRALLAHRAGPRTWDHAVCDEAQDLAEIQVELVLRLQAGVRLDGLLLAGDPQQVINPSGFRWAEVRTAIRDRSRAGGRPAPALTSLTRNFRSVRGVVELANALLALKRERTGRSDGDDIEQATVAGATPLRVEGSEAELAAAVAGFGPRCAVLVGSEEARGELQALLGTTRIFTVPDAKGLEFDVVVLWGLVAADPEPWARLLDPALDLREDPACRRALHHLYVAVTRARRHLAVHEPAGAMPLWTSPWLAARLDAESPASLARLFVRASSPAEWLAEAEYFIARGRHRQAAECFRRAGEAQREIECLALHHEQAGDGAAAAPLWLQLGERTRAARCLEEAGAWAEAGRLWLEQGDETAARRCQARGAEHARDWASAGAAWEALGHWADAGRCWANAGRRGRQIRCLGEGAEAEARWADAARHWEEAEAWDRAAACWRRAGRERDAWRSEALGHEGAGRFAGAAEAWRQAGDEARARRAGAAAAETDERWADAASLWEGLDDIAAAARAWRRAGRPREAALCEARIDESAGRHARAADALEGVGELTAAAAAWRRAHEAGQRPSRSAPLVLPADAGRKWTEGGRPARLLAGAPVAARRDATRDSRVRGLACEVTAAEAAGRFADAEAIWKALGDAQQALRCLVERHERDGAHAAAAEALEGQGLFPAAGRAWSAAGDTRAATRCEAKRLDKKRRYEEAESLWLSLGAATEAALSRGRLFLHQGDYRAAAEAFSRAGHAAFAVNLSVMAAEEEGDWAGAVALAEAHGRPDLVPHIRRAQEQAARDAAARPPGAEADPAAPRASRPRRPAREQAEAESGETARSQMDRLLAEVGRHPGVRSEDLARLTGIERVALGPLLRAGIAAGRLTKAGATRATRYWAVDSATPGPSHRPNIPGP